VKIRIGPAVIVVIIGSISVFAIACGGSAAEVTEPSSTPTAVPTWVVIAVTPVSTAPTPTVGSETNAEGEPVLVVFNITDRSIEGPASIPSGLTTIRLQNDGSAPHGLTVIRADVGRTAEIIETQSKSRSFPVAWAPSLASVVAPSGGSTEFTVRLTPGIYGAVDWTQDSTGVPWTAFGLYLGFEVTDSGSVEIEWPEDAIEIGLEDFKFTGLTDLESGSHTLLLKNKSATQHHEILFVPLDEGQTAAELFEGFEYGFRGGEPIPNLQRAFGIGWIGPEQIVLFSIDFPAGNYAIVDLAPSSISGSANPQVNLGMLEQIAVSE